jgi:hypothetical protein
MHRTLSIVNDSSSWTSTSASGTASAATLKDVIDLINQLPGFKAWVLHAPHAMSVNSGHFIDLAETSIKTGVGVNGTSEVLQRDVSEFVDANSDKVLWARIGLPEERDRNAMRLLRVDARALRARLVRFADLAHPHVQIFPAGRGGRADRTDAARSGPARCGRSGRRTGCGRSAGRPDCANAPRGRRRTPDAARPAGCGWRPGTRQTPGGGSSRR